MTSLQWLNSSVYDIPESPGDPSVWKHEVIVIEPRVNKHRNAVLVYATGGHNGHNALKPGEPISDDEVNALDIAAFEAEMVTVVIKQLPNCMIIFKES